MVKKANIILQKPLPNGSCNIEEKLNDIPMYIHMYVY